jgi:hypothetical protein
MTRRFAVARAALAANVVRHTRSITNSRQPFHAEMLEPRTLLSGTLPFGGIVTGDIPAIGAVDDWTFAGAENATVAIGLRGIPRTNNFDARATLLDPDGLEVRSFFSGGHTQATLEKTGTYTVRVQDSGNNGTGGFKLSLEGINPASPDAAALAKGTITAGGITADQLEVDEYLITVAPGEAFTLSLSSKATTNNFDAVMDIYNPAAESVRTVFAGGRSRFDLQDPGQYVLLVHDSGYNAIGSYKIAYEGLSPISPNPGKPKSGGLTDGAIDDPIEVDQFVFAAHQGDRLGITLKSKAKTGNFNPVIDVYNSAGEHQRTVFSGGQDLFTLETDDTYTLDIHDSGYNATGSYTFGLETVRPPSSDARILPPGAARTATFAGTISADQYTFSAVENDQLRFTLVGKAIDAGFNLVGEIFDESGTEVLPLFTTVNEFQAPSTGTYTIQLHDQSFGRRGQYTLTMLRLSPRIGAISGTVFHDLDGDGRQDAAEGGLAGWRVFIDRNNNGKRDSGEVSTTTDAIGSYTFPRVAAGTYVVRATPSTGYFITAPASKLFATKLIAGQVVTTDNFGAAYKAVLSGSVFNDVNGNAKRETATEPLLGGFTVFLDKNKNGRLDAGERKVVTGADGGWGFDGLTAGSYVVRVLRPSNYRSTLPSSGAFTVLVAANKVAGGKLFGVRRIS